MQDITFEKWEGLGNDFIVINEPKRLTDKSALAKQLCNRKSSLGADGLIILSKSNKADIAMEILNSDGSVAEMCGNALRCIAKILGKEKSFIKTASGIREVILLEDGNVRVNMGFVPQVTKQGEIMSLKLQNPHAVLFVEDFDFDWQSQGKGIEHDRKRFPNGTNTNFVKITTPSCIELKTWERGVGATHACGTGACASVITAYKKGLVGRKVVVNMSGGSLFIEIRGKEIFMTGPAEKITDGKIEI